MSCHLKQRQTELLIGSIVLSRIGRGNLIGSLEQAERDMFAHRHNLYFYSVCLIEMSLEFSLGSVTLYCNVMDDLGANRLVIMCFWPKGVISLGVSGGSLMLLIFDHVQRGSEPLGCVSYITSHD